MDRKTLVWLVVRGVAAIAFGVLSIVWPQVTIFALALLFGAYAFVDGVSNLITFVRRRGAEGRRFVYLIAGIVGVVVGGLTLVWPGPTALVLVALIGAWAIFTGLLNLWTASRPRGQWLVALIGALALVAGVFVLLRPDVGAIVIARVIGVYAIVAGALMLVEAWRVRRALSAGRQVTA